MWKIKNLSTNKEQIWYSEDEYKKLEQKIEAYELESQEAKEIIAELEWKCKKLMKELEDK